MVSKSWMNVKFGRLSIYQKQYVCMKGLKFDQGEPRPTKRGGKGTFSRIFLLSDYYHFDLFFFFYRIILIHSCSSTVQFSTNLVVFILAQVSFLFFSSLVVCIVGGKCSKSWAQRLEWLFINESSIVLLNKISFFGFVYSLKLIELCGVYGLSKCPVKFQNYPPAPII